VVLERPWRRYINAATQKDVTRVADCCGENPDFASHFRLNLAHGRRENGFLFTISEQTRASTRDVDPQSPSGRC